MAETDPSFVTQHPLLALLGVAVLTAAIDLLVTYGYAGEVQPVATVVFVVLVTGAYAILLYRKGTLEIG